MRCKLFLAIISAYTYMGCKHNLLQEASPTDDFRQVKERLIQGTKVFFESDSVLYDPRTITIYDSFAICYDNSGTTGYSIVNLKNGKLVERFAYSGEGYSKFNINALSLNRTGKAENIISILQPNPPYRFFLYNADSLLNTSIHYQPDYFYQFPKRIYFDKLVLLNDSIVLGGMGLTAFDSKMFGIINMRQHQLITGIDIPLAKGELLKHFYDQQYLPWTRNNLEGNIVLRPGGTDDVVYMSSKGALVQIFNIDRQLNFKIIYQKLYYLPLFELVDHGNSIISTVLSKECRYGFNDIAVTKDKIYALYNGNFTSGSDSRKLSANLILVYDWNGKALGKIRLDQDCYKIAIDYKVPKVLYALHSFNNIGIYKYDLPE